MAQDERKEPSFIGVYAKRIFEPQDILCEECGGWMGYVALGNYYRCYESWRHMKDGPPKNWPEEPKSWNCEACRRTPSGKCEAH